MGATDDEVLNKAIDDHLEELKKERMYKFFDFAHLPDHLKVVSSLFYGLAVELINTLEPGPERTVALRKLLEAKDAAVRAAVHPGG